MRFKLRSLIFLIAFFFLESLSPVIAQEHNQLVVKKDDYNVVLIIIDTLRPDHLGCYGYPQDTSPNIDRIAQDSVIFENAFSNAGHTMPSTMSILTSLYPSSHRMFHIYKDKLSPRVQTMAEILQDYNYQTAWFSLLKEPPLNIDIGFGRGFQDKVELNSEFGGRQELLTWLDKHQKNKFFLAVDTRKLNSYLWSSQSKSLKGISIQDREKLYNDLQELTRNVYYESVKLADCGEAPFDDPKLIAQHAELFNGIYAAEKMWQIKALVDASGRSQLHDTFGGLFAGRIKKVASENPKASIAAYDAAVEAVDTELIKPLYDKLKTLGVYDETIIIITADHGEAFWEHGCYGHGLLYPEINRVPLIIKLPYAKASKKTKELAQGIDILPTVLDLVGIEKPHQAQGKSLVGLITGKDALGPNKYVFAESLGRKSIRSQEWKIELPDHDDAQYGSRELFHLTIDPQEHNNVYALESKVAAKLEKELRQWEAGLPSYQDQEYPFDPGIDPAAQERIKKTGYF